MKKAKTNYKRWLIQWNENEQVFELFTPSELEQPVGCRYPEMEVSTMEQAKEFINNY